MAIQYKDKKKKEKPINIETIVISQTKHFDRIVKRMVVEKAELTKGKFQSTTYHEQLSSSGTWARSRNKGEVKRKSSKPIIHALKKEYRPY